MHVLGRILPSTTSRYFVQVEDSFLMLIHTRQATLSVLVRNFTFEFPDGPGTPIDVYVAFAQRPKVAGAKASEVPMYVRRIE